MSITVNIYYRGEGDNALRFAREMIASGTVEKIRAEEGNLQYEYFVPLEEKNTVLLIDSWASQEAIDTHHQSEMMKTIADMRNKYDLHMTVKRFVSDEEIPEKDTEFIRK